MDAQTAVRVCTEIFGHTITHNSSSAVSHLIGIRENPSSDAHRLIYADWLEEKGNTAAADLIRRCVRIENATLPLPEKIAKLKFLDDLNTEKIGHWVPAELRDLLITDDPSIKFLFHKGILDRIYGDFTQVEIERILRGLPSVRSISSNNFDLLTGTETELLPILLQLGSSTTFKPRWFIETRIVISQRKLKYIHLEVKMDGAPAYEGIERGGVNLLFATYSNKGEFMNLYSPNRNGKLKIPVNDFPLASKLYYIGNR